MLLSGVAGSALDSALFLWLAFDSTAGWWQLAVVKVAVLALATPAAVALRRRLAPA